jgi:hypothetical protein
VADVTDAILGADFINHVGLIVDLRAKKLYSQDRAETTNGRVKPTNQFGIRAIFDSVNERFQQLLRKYPDDHHGVRTETFSFVPHPSKGTTGTLQT